MKGPRSGPPPPDASWNFAIPDKLKLVIADAIVTFARKQRSWKLFGFSKNQHSKKSES
jgi:hypothetical protein